MRFRLITLSLVALLAVLSGLQAATELRPALIRVEITNLDQMRELLVLDLDVIGVKPGESVEVLVSDQDLIRISQAGFKYEMVYSDMTAHLQAGLSGQMDMGGYHTLTEVYAALDSIQSEHPGIVTVRDSVGYTIQGRALYAVKISDNPGTDEDEPEVFFNALTHAREPMGMEVLLYYMRYLTDNYGSDSRVDSIVNNRELWFIPVVNPDGYLYNESIAPSGGGMWRKNRRNNGGGSFGVDLNRNYGHKWGYDNIGSSPGTNSQIYRGTAPFSEPETQGMRDFVLAHDFVIIINYHTYSDLLLYPWGYTPTLPTDRRVFEDICEDATAVNDYIWGPGYSTIYPTNGDSDDWMYGEQALKKKSFSMTPEVGGFEDGGFWPPESMIPVHTAENLEANLIFAERAGELFRHSAWCLAIEPYLIDTVIYYNDSLTLPVKLRNWAASAPLYFKAASAEAPNWMTAGTEESLFTISSSDSFQLNLKIKSQGLAIGNTYYGEILIASHNDSIPAYSDSSFVPVQIEVKCSGLAKPGDANASSTWTLGDIISTVNYVFNKPGCAPTPICWLSGLICRGDWNGNGSVTLGDVIQGVNYIFNKPGGPWNAVNSDVCCSP